MTRSNRRATKGSPRSPAYKAFYGCGRKVGYPDRDSAELAAWAQRTEESEPVPYDCPHGCGMLHLSHDRESRMGVIARRGRRAASAEDLRTRRHE